MKYALFSLALFLVSCSGSLTSSSWLLEPTFPGKPEIITQNGTDELGDYKEEHHFLEQDKFVYVGVKRQYKGPVPAATQQKFYDLLVNQFLQTKRAKKSISRKDIQLGEGRGRQYRMQFDDHAGDYILIFEGSTLYLFGVESESTQLLNSTNFLQSIKINN